MKECMSKNNKVKYLHLFPIEKFANDYIKFVNNNFNSKEHLFLVFGRQNFQIDEKRNIVKISKNTKGLLCLFSNFYKCRRVFLHGLFVKEIVLFLFLQPWLLKKCNWILWGGDLYYYKFRKKNFKEDLYEKIRKYVIKNIGEISTFIKGDYELAQKWYGARGKHYSFLYPSAIYKDNILYEDKKRKGNKIYIQVGNSADPTNNHLEVLRKLEKYKNENIEIVCPLSYSYGDSCYRNIVIKEGVKIFGNKFKPLLEFMPIEEYLKILAKIDIAIFNHKRQQAGSNIIPLLGFGKKVYIRDDIVTWNFLNSYGIKVYKSNGNFNSLLKKVPDEIKLKNINIIKNHFTEEKLKEDWEKIFQSK